MLHKTQHAHTDNITQIQIYNTVQIYKWMPDVARSSEKAGRELRMTDWKSQGAQRWLARS
jgi:hypothetical protein